MTPAPTAAILPPPHMSKSFADLKKLWTDNKGDAGDAETAAAVALAESSGNPNAMNKGNTNGTWDIGLWQINTIHSGAFGLPALTDYKKPALGPNIDAFVKNLQDANKNATVAVKLKKVQGWKAWAAYNSGAYMKFLPK